MVDFKKIRLVVSDFDGVMTDNKVLVDENGKEYVFCNRGDGLGIELLKKNSCLDIIVISKEKNPVVQARCKKLKIECRQGVDDKAVALLEETKKRGLDIKQVCFIGNDLNDIECIKAAGIGVGVADSHASVLKVANFITKNKGGNGAIREIIDLIL
jgi:YrbI family 3-deoxy-D-manno-octulosonate 8-phosphate phosphatase